MNIVFFGSSHFACPSLKALAAAGYNISCVVTQPDKKKGRGLHLAQTLVKKAAQDLNLMLYQFANVNNPETIKCLKDLQPDLFIIIAYGQIVSQEILDIPKLFAVNVHASLLPKYRGAAPINWAIINGDKETGITIIKITRRMDAGPIIVQQKVKIDEKESAITLEEKLSRQSAPLLIQCLQSIQDNKYALTPQDRTNVIYAHKLKKIDGLIRWEKNAREISNLIRGSFPWPGSFTFCKRKIIKVHAAKILSAFDLPRPPLPGEIIMISKEGIMVATGNDNLLIEELQPEGKRIMKADEFISGHKICVGDRFGTS